MPVTPQLPLGHQLIALIRDGNAAAKRKGLDQLSLVLTPYIADSKQGAAFAWGSGSNFQLGETCAFLSTKDKPSRVEELPPDVCAVTTTKMHSVVLSSSGTVWTSGIRRAAGQLITLVGAQYCLASAPSS